MQGGEADVVPEQEEAVAQVDGKAQVFGGGPHSASAIAMLVSSRTVLCGALRESTSFNTQYSIPVTVLFQLGIHARRRSGRGARTGRSCSTGRWQSPSIWRWPKFRFGDCDVVIEPDRSLWRTPTPSVYLCRPSLVEPLLLFICATGLMGKCSQRLFSRFAVIGNDVYSPVLQLLVMPLLSVCVLVSTVLG